MAASLSVENSKDEAIRSQMTKFGWLEGKGLGKKEQGRKEAIKVSLKNNKNGLGLDPSEQFVFHWWDHVFNKVASSIKIEEGEEEVTISKHKENQLEGNISSKRPNNVTKGKELLYGRFVKSGTTIMGNEMVTNAKQTQSSDDSDDEKDFSNSDTLEKAFKMSGGMTAHKAARHGHQLNGKLKRLQDQEGASYNVKSHAVSHDSSQVICNIDSSDSSENSSHLKPVAKDIVGEIKKMKKKKKDKSLKKTEHVTGELDSISDTLDFHSKDCSSICGKPRKKEKKSNKNSLRECQKIHKESERGDVCSGKDKTKAQMKDYENCLIDTEKESSNLKEEKRKKKKKRKRTSSQCEDIEKDQVYISQVPESHQDKGPKKKKKKKREIIENC